MPFRHGNPAIVSAPDALGDGGAAEAARDEFQRQMLAAYERGILDGPEYTARVAALESAASITAMAAIAARPPSGASAGDWAAFAALDPVDLARLAAAPTRKPVRSHRSRYAALVAVVVVFVVMVVAGLLYASRLHDSSETGGVVVAPLVVAGAS